MDDSLLARLSTVVPGEKEQIGYPPENKFIPKILVEKKRDRAETEQPAVPVLIS